MLSRTLSRRTCLLLRSPATASGIDQSRAAAQALTQRRGLVAAPKPGDGPLMERRADRELPDVERTQFRWSRTLPVFLALVGCCSLAIFNYQKSSSPVVASTLYALRVSPEAREYLGDEIYFKQSIPWIRGEMNQLKGRIDIRFTVKGSKNWAVMRFASNRPTPRGMFETTEWSLETPEGRKIDLLSENDPFRGIQPDKQLEGFYDEDGDEDDTPKTRGFRQMNRR